MRSENRARDEREEDEKGFHVDWMRRQRRELYRAEVR